MNRIDENLQRVEERIQRACAASGRGRESVTLVAVSKTQPVERIREAVAAGLTLFGENKVQEALAKIPELSSALHWHLIGHLQTNKVKHALHCRFELIHGVDSLRLLDALDAAAAEAGLVQPVLIQVNVSGEGSKSGLPPQELLPLLEQAASRMNLDVQGLMTIPPASENPENAASHFARLRDLRDQARAATGFPLEVLSMGMSHDLEVAIREGATIVRVGSDLFGARS
jgi:pyridoxal phosphate enzyme (YggS family)